MPSAACETPVVTVEQDGHVLRVGVDRPAKRNAWDLAVIEQLSRALERVDDDDVRACVLFGHGAHFSAGLDLSQVLPAIGRGGSAALGGSGRYDPFGLFGEPLPVPVVLAVQGIAFTLSTSWRSRATSWCAPMTSAFVSSRSAAASCPSAAPRSAVLASWAGATRCGSC